jgi:hypothetical protein
MKTIIAGSRSASREDVSNAMRNCPFTYLVSTVISGTARGADTFGEDWALANEINIVRFPADWAKFKRAAGPIRNKEMAEFGEALIAVWDGRSPGTKNMIKNARHLGLKVYIWNLALQEGYLV